jgi:hypothetical protein
LARHPQIEAIPILDERSAAFFALGLAKQLYQPVVLVCTSGTATANFYPAVIEAKESHVPLLILTADRPQNCVMLMLVRLSIKSNSTVIIPTGKRKLAVLVPISSVYAISVKLSSTRGFAVSILSPEWCI